jgi:2-amino-4-hydroxy-6-hydroxymethyldihydropteridine diphosphokinase
VGIAVILIGLGANLPSPAGAPVATFAAALDALGENGVRVLVRSRWYRTAPVPASDQPDFVNGVVAVSAALEPGDLLALMHRIEARFGRVRGLPNAARPLDLDLLAYDDRVMTGSAGPILPHPRLHERAFVLLPLKDVAPGWRHPLLGRTVEEMIAALPPGQEATPLSSGAR